MPKANLRGLDSSVGQFQKAECSVCGEKFYCKGEREGRKQDLQKQFDAHLFNRHRSQWDAIQRKRIVKKQN